MVAGEITIADTLQTSAEGDIRLVDGGAPWKGRLQVFHDQTWGTVCNDSWSYENALVVCRQRGYAGVASSYQYFGPGYGPIHLGGVVCTGNEDSLTGCSHNDWDDTNCTSHEQDVGVKCTEETFGVPETGAVRLADGSGSHEGRVEIFYDSQWGTVCDDYWDILDASVVCRQLGFSSATDAFRWAFFGGGSPTQPIYLNNVYCDGNEAELSDCEHSGWEIENCVHYEDAGVRCFIEYNEGDIRLADGPTSRDGRLEIYHNNEWGTVCNTTWGYEEAEVICRQLGNDGVNNVYYSPTPRNGSIHLSHVDCIGSETELLGCDVTFSDNGNSSCTHGEDVGVDCYTLLSDPSALEGELRQTNSLTPPTFGRLEIYHGNSWGTVCFDGWHQNDSEVACRQLGYLSAGPVYENTAATGFIGPVHLAEVSCTGDEYELAHCSHGGWGNNDCRHTDDIYLQCIHDYEAGEGDTRLVDGENSWEGRLQVFHDRKWGTVCNDSWSYENALVVCRQLGYAGVVSSYRYFGPGYGPIHLGGVVCTGNEDSLTDCSHNEWDDTNCTSHEQDIGVQCTEEMFGKLGDVRLADGSGSHEGRVEIFYDSQWGTVCDDDWDMFDASVVCKQLGFSAATDAFPYAFFGGGSPTQPIYLDNVHCNGTEAKLADCEHNGWNIDNCLHFEDAGVRCFFEYNEGDIRLADGPMSRDGRLEIYHNNEWGTVCNTTWGPEEAEVTCRQLGNDGVNNVYYSPSPGNGSTHLSRVDCIGNETGLVNCSITFSDDGNSSCTHGEDVGVDCYTLLTDPTGV
ncbi:scavenger receptor cysteine-rich domain superfamily protein-like [Diadema setosum]|uniref:scavenger receptor cysteine-rich domain superfamily protein-like n=1 Tax=Diadema setosum TaxID=31175 RepID=UPI003B3BC67F